MDNHLFLQQQLAMLKKSFSEKLPGHLRDLEHAWKQYHQSPQDKQRGEYIQETLRSLSHSTRTFELPQMSSCMHELELEIEKLLHAQSTLNTDTVENIQQKFSTLNMLMLTEVANKEKSDWHESTTENYQSQHIDYIYIDSQDAKIVKNLENILATYNQNLQGTTAGITVEDLNSNIKNALTIVDLTQEANPQLKLDKINQWQQQFSTPIPVVFIASVDSLQLRLASVRAGGEGYFVAPVDIDDFIATLDNLILAKEAEPYRVLIVEDKTDPEHNYNAYLQKAGMLPHILSNPLQIVPALTEFKPELILLNLNTPSCKGYELAKVIRQFNRYIDIPIVFLTSVIDDDIRSRALKVGDDYLIKPVTETELMASVLSRAERARLLTSIMTTDSLTGLLNQQKIKQRLQTELERAQRYKTDLSVVMLDLDHFKKINDTYGHLVGDKVLKTLAHILKTQIRKIDASGRYGGEEFLIILPNISETVAKTVVEKIKQNFSELEHIYNGERVFATFSAGIGSIKNDSTLNNLITRADKAMYAAKQRGRNLVLTAGETQ